MGKHARPLLVLALLAALVPFVAGCGYWEEKKIAKALEERADALQKGEARAYLSFFTPDYQDDWVAFGRLAEKAASRLGQRPLPIISFGDREIVIRGDKALVTERFTLEDSSQGKPRRYDEIQHLRLERKEDGWRCRRGSEVLRLLGGRIEEEAAIEETLLRREAGLVKRDIAAYMDLVAPEYQHRGETKKDVREKLMRIFQIYDDIQFRSYDRKIWFFGDSATVQQKFTMTASMVGEPRTFNDEERFELVKTEQGWKFTKGL